MKIRILTAFFAAVLAMLIPSFFVFEKADNADKDYVKNVPQRDNEIETEDDDLLVISVLMGENAVEMDIEDYLVGVVAGEMPFSFEDEAIKAQAVAARTYTLYKLRVEPSANHSEDVCTNPACCKAYSDEAVLREKWGADYDGNIARIRSLVWSTRGTYMVYENEPVLAVFHSSSAGMTENSGDVWNEDLPYLSSVASPEGAESVRNYVTVTQIEHDDFKMRFLKENPDAEFSENSDEWVTDIIYTDSGRIKSLCIGGISVRGTELRSIYGLRSTAADIEVGEDCVVFAVTGYGHGVGMSQYGANSMAKEGSSWQEILEWYYTGISFDTLLGTI